MTYKLTAADRETIEYSIRNHKEWTDAERAKDMLAGRAAAMRKEMLRLLAGQDQEL